MLTIAQQLLDEHFPRSLHERILEALNLPCGIHLAVSCCPLGPLDNPDLNLIELLWRKIHYEWFPLDAYLNGTTLTASLFDVLTGIGSKYRITFAWLLL